MKIASTNKGIKMSCPWGKQTERQCTSLRADDCGSKSMCGVWKDCPNCGAAMIDGYCYHCDGVSNPKKSKRVVPAESFVGTLAANVDNKKMSNKDFRQLVRNTLPIVIYKA